MDQKYLINWVRTRINQLRNYHNWAIGGKKGDPPIKDFPAGTTIIDEAADRVYYINILENKEPTDEEIKSKLIQILGETWQK